MIANSNVDGNMKIKFALACIKGIGQREANIICKKCGINFDKRAGELTIDEVNRIVAMIENPLQLKIPETAEMTADDAAVLVPTPTQVRRPPFEDMANLSAAVDAMRKRDNLALLPVIDISSEDSPDVMTNSDIEAPLPAGVASKRSRPR